MSAILRSATLCLLLGCAVTPVAGQSRLAGAGAAASDAVRVAPALETVLALRRALRDATRVVADRHAALERAAAAVRDGTHPEMVAIAELRGALSEEVAGRRADDAQAAHRSLAEREALEEWLEAARDELAALDAERASLHARYLRAKEEHDELAAELGETIDAFNAGVLAFNAGSVSGAAREAEAGRLRGLESRIVQGRTELDRRRGQALERHAALSGAERTLRTERASVVAVRARREQALAAARASASARDDQALVREAGRVSARVAELECAIRDELTALRAARDEALRALEHAYGPDHAALAEAIDRWLGSGARDGLFTASGAGRFDRSHPEVDALYAALAALDRAARPPALRIVEEE